MASHEKNPRKNEDVIEYERKLKIVIPKAGKNEKSVEDFDINQDFAAKLCVADVDVLCIKEVMSHGKTGGIYLPDHLQTPDYNEAVEQYYEAYDELQQAIQECNRQMHESAQVMFRAKHIDSLRARHNELCKELRNQNCSSDEEVCYTLDELYDCELEISQLQHEISGAACLWAETDIAQERAAAKFSQCNVYLRGILKDILKDAMQVRQECTEEFADYLGIKAMHVIGRSNNIGSDFKDLYVVDLYFCDAGEFADGEGHGHYSFYVEQGHPYYLRDEGEPHGSQNFVDVLLGGYSCLRKESS